ncbi:MAG: thioredoxin [Deltaproteobacteria bacterium]|nr:MAG: thioredoxin [Deltaproteobacteria bacterium]RLC17235.1 MAG: thioredoxin [Deltaproteobacteria bacterium]
MKKNQKLLGISAVGFIVALVIFGAVRSQYLLTPCDTSALSTQSTAIKALGKVTMIDLGATECIPCKMMAPIMEELEKEYAGKADIIFIDVWKNPDQAKKYGIRAIPTQIFFDAEGREAFRHEGFMDKKSIVQKLAKLGVS